MGKIGKVQLHYHGSNNRWAWLGITDRNSQGSYRYESDNHLDGTQMSLILKLSIVYISAAQLGIGVIEIVL